jgi:hypothetical protein
MDMAANLATAILREGTQFNDQDFAWDQVRIVPQGWDAVLFYMLSETGQVVENLADEQIGVVNAGGLNVHLLTVNGLRDVPAQSGCPEIGVWKVVQDARTILQAQDKGYILLRDHQIATRIASLEGRDPAITEIIQRAGEEIVTEARRHWRTGVILNRIIVVGGGALLWGKQIAQAFPSVRVDIPTEPQMAPVRGLCRFAKYLQQGV